MAKEIELDTILKTVSEKRGISLDEMKSKRRFADYVFARQLFCFFARKYTPCSLAKIGKVINIKHSAVMHSIKRSDRDFLLEKKRIELIFETT